MGQKETLLTAKEFASRSGLSVTQVTKMLRDKKLDGHKKSGKWMIPASALKTSGVRATPAKTEKTAAAKSDKSTPTAATLSVADFSAKTYLTEAGVVQWLKKGRLRGSRTPDGDWQVDAASLDLPVLRHLLRS